MSGSIAPSAIHECRRREAEARRFAAASRNAAEKADILEVAETWLKLARSSASDDEFKETAEVVGW
jgi:hypothetical protein